MSTHLPRVLVALTVLLPFSACQPGSPGSDEPAVVVTVFPVADLARRMAGDGVRVETLLPPRASPATWEATPAQIRVLDRARGVISVGAGLDTWVEGLIPEAGVRHLRITDGMDLRDARHDHRPEAGHDADAGGDPHVWLDPLLVRDEIIPRLQAFLGDLLPGQAPVLADRAAAVADSLTALDREIRSILGSGGGRRFVATHDAWGYFAGAYGLESVGSVYERPGHEPSARSLARLVRDARAAGLPSILAEPQLATTAAEALAAELEVEIRIVDPLGGPELEGRESYFDMMRFNAMAFREALGGP